MNRRQFTQAAAGAVFLPLALTSAQSSPPGDAAINARDYGAIGDGVADDTAALLAALAAARVSSARCLSGAFAFFYMVGFYMEGVYMAGVFTLQFLIAVTS